MGAYADKVRSARGVQEALVLLAEGIDAILAADKSDWMSWGDEPRKPTANFGSIAALAGDEAYDRLQADAEYDRALLALKANPDDEAARAIVQRHVNRSLEHVAGGSAQWQSERSAESSEVTVGAVSVKKREQRRQLEQQRLNLAAHLGDGEDWTEAYELGGPMWLYLSNRDLVMSYPADVLRAMVEDVEEDSPQDAREMARDVLKEACADGPSSAGMRTAEGDVG